MRVFAQYYAKGDKAYRSNTLLQFGDSWRLIGNAVLANPGSSTPREPISNKQLLLLEAFFTAYRNDEGFNSENWFCFSVDSTMRQLEKLFSGWYLDRVPLELEGVIQLFNTFDLIEPDLVKAIQICTQVNTQFASDEICVYFNQKPTYFGFSQSVTQHPKLKHVAKAIFDATPESVKQVYKTRFEDNAFYHPGYINRQFKQDSFSHYLNTVVAAMVVRG